MPWLPRYESLDGIIRGNTPAGSLSLVPDFLSGQNYFEDNQSANGNADYRQNEPTDILPDWVGAYGTNGFTLLDWMDSNGDHTNIMLAEFEVEKPEGATYYKQTLSVSINTELIETDDEQGEHWDYYSISIYGIQRRVYADPNTPGMVTHEWRPYYSIGGIFGYRHITDPAETFNNLEFKRFYIAFGYLEHNDRKFFGVFLYANLFGHINLFECNQGSLYAVDNDLLEDAFGTFEIPEVEEDPNDDPENPPDEEDGGDGEHKRPVDPIPFPDLPSVGGMNAGFITMYKLTPAEMWVFAQSFFSDTLLEKLRDFFGNPMDIFVGLGIVPFIPEGNELWYPMIGDSVYVSRHPITRISNQYYILDCGSVKLDEYGRNALDYSPYTKILIWLPYIGYRQLPVDEVMGKNIHVKYYCDCLGGDCVAIISTQVVPQGMNPPVDVVIAQYNGNILTQVPVASVSYDNLISNVVNSAIGGLGVMADAAAGGLDGSAVTKQINSLTSAVAGVVNGMKPVMKRDGSPGSSSGLLSVQKPYIIRHIPNQSLPSTFAKVIGYPSNIGGSLGDGFSGLAVVEDIQLNNIPAMEPEREEIKQLLREGVII